MPVLAQLSPVPQVVAFDAYGTLLDVHSAVNRLADRMGPDARGVSALWRSKQLEYTWVLSLAGRYRSFWQLTEDALDFALASHPAVDPGVRAGLLDAYRSLSAYPEVADTLRRLRDQGLRLCVLSNADRRMLDTALESAGVADLVEAALSVDAVGTFKTAPAAYRMVCDHFGTSPDRALLVSSNRWDIAGARAFGLRAVWVNRLGMPGEYADLAPSAVIASLDAL